MKNEKMERKKEKREKLKCDKKTRKMKNQHNPDDNNTTTQPTNNNIPQHTALVSVGIFFESGPEDSVEPRVVIWNHYSDGLAVPTDPVFPTPRTGWSPPRALPFRPVEACPPCWV